jgi:hypothetical protein
VNAQVQEIRAQTGFFDNAPANGLDLAAFQPERSA